MTVRDQKTLCLYQWYRYRRLVVTVLRVFHHYLLPVAARGRPRAHLPGPGCSSSQGASLAAAPFQPQRGHFLAPQTDRELRKPESGARHRTSSRPGAGTPGDRRRRPAFRPHFQDGPGGLPRWACGWLGGGLPQSRATRSAGTERTMGGGQWVGMPPVIDPDDQALKTVYSGAFRSAESETGPGPSFRWAPCRRPRQSDGARRHHRSLLRLSASSSTGESPGAGRGGSAAHAVGVCGGRSCWRGTAHCALGLVNTELGMPDCRQFHPSRTSSANVSALPHFCIPRRRILQERHCMPLGGHFGRHKTAASVRRLAHWPGQTRDSDVSTGKPATRACKMVDFVSLRPLLRGMLVPRPAAPPSPLTRCRRT